MQRYLVECYAPATFDVAECEREARVAGARGQIEGSGVRHVRTTLVPDDELAFHVFDAPSLTNLEAALAGTGLVPLRIVGAHESEQLAPTTATDGQSAAQKTHDSKEEK